MIEAPNPKYSVLLPVHTWHSFLVEAVESILLQTFQDFELLLICNGPECLLIENIKDLWQNEPRVTVLSTPIPGLVFALNYGIHCARGEWIVRMDSDDLSHFDRFEITNMLLNKSHNIDILSTGIELIDEHGNTKGCYQIDDKLDSELRSTLPIKSCLPHPTVVVKRSLLLQIGGYSYGQYSEDYDLWLRIRRQTDAVFFHYGKPLLKYRIHPDQVTNKNRLRTIFKYDLALRFRELLLSGDILFLKGIFYAIGGEIRRSINRFCGN